MRSQKFTLIEMLVVVAIIAILAGFIGAAAMNSIRTAKIAACGNNLKQHGTIIEIYRNENNQYYPPWLSAANDDQPDLYKCPLDDSEGAQGGRPDWLSLLNTDGKDQQYAEANDMPKDDFSTYDESSAGANNRTLDNSADYEKNRGKIYGCSYLYEFNAAPSPGWYDGSYDMYDVTIASSWYEIKIAEMKKWPDWKPFVPISRCYFHIEPHASGQFDDATDKVLNLRISGEVNNSPSDKWYEISSN